MIKVVPRLLERPWTVCVPAYCPEGLVHCSACARRLDWVQGRGRRLWTKSEQISVSLFLSLFLVFLEELTTVCRSWEEGRGCGRSGRRSSCGAWGGNRGVALVGGLDWDGPAVGGGLLGKGDNNKAARVSEGQGEGEGEGPGPRAREWSSLPAKTPTARPTSTWMYKVPEPALVSCCFCRSCVHLWLVADDWLVVRLLPKRALWTSPGRRPGRCPPGWWDGAAIKGYVSAPLWPVWTPK